MRTKHDYKKSFTLAIFIFIVLLGSYLTYTSVTRHKNKSFLVISDIHVDLSEHTMNLSPNGYDKHNDSDKKIYLEFVKMLKNNINIGKIEKPDFILVLGDLVGHVRTKTSVLEEESLVFKTLKQQFDPIPIFYVFGNNDSFLVNYGPFSHDHSPFSIAKSNGWIDGFLSSGVICKGSKHFPCIEDQTKNVNSGYYAGYLLPNLKILGINSVLFSAVRKEVKEDEAENELQWLDTQLANTSKNNEQVLLAMHIPPGKNVYDDSSFWQSADERRFLHLINQYKNNIIGIWVGHTHMEELKLIQGERNNIITAVYFTPALSTAHGNSPSAKIYNLKNKNNQWAVSNYKTYYFTKENNQLTLKPLYEFNQYYCQNKNETVSECLTHVSAKKMKKYFTVGNDHFAGHLRFPNNIFINISRELDKA